MIEHKVWDPALRVFHWALAVGFAANALVIEDDSRLHAQLGYAIAALLGLRLLWGLVGPRHARFASFPLSPAGILRHLSDIATARRRAHLGHSPLGAAMIWNLLLSVAAIALTGHMMTLDAYWGRAWVEELHEALVVWAGLSIGLHVAAVIWESRRTGINLPRAMVTGVKTVPDGVIIDP
ncbi:cytochrome b/b6 domain-containing protein [Thalassococcus sp. CAU 1522]|uniref:Cytochrome b/b6 domain-containing protein n=1 Tax=Thalassococcus arenae TaxID=2851652 RepID=A0ABS6NAP1_9RHOB|nr:cytochrome b/b6 domain-containing protein [Thalassococcus arenae]MBV2361038.1 cytochrome b/b6 domain-containing protein [Thalassococcus arenae]